MPILSSQIVSIQRARHALGFVGLAVLATAIVFGLGAQSSRAATSAVSPTMHADVPDNSAGAKSTASFTVA